MNLGFKKLLGKVRKNRIVEHFDKAGS